MMTLLVALIGAGFAGGLILIGRGVRSRPAPLSTVSKMLDRRPMPQAALVEQDRRSRVGGMVVALATMSMSGAQVATQLRVLRKPVERQAWEKLIGAVAGFALPVMLGVLLTLGGIGVNWLYVMVISLLLATVGFVYPDLPLSEQVKTRQREFRHALSGYLDLVAIFSAGGAGVEAALESAANAGSGWEFEQIQVALRRGRVLGLTPWEALQQLGEELDIRELRELAGAVALAGGHGARIRSSLIAKADAMRGSELTRLETEAEQQSERMVVPLSAMVFGMVLFIGYGAVQAISTTPPVPPAVEVQQTNQP